MFLSTVLKHLEGRPRNFMIFNINLWSIKKVIFGFSIGYPVSPIAMSLSGSTPDFLKLSFYMFPYNEMLKIFKIKI